MTWQDAYEAENEMRETDRRRVLEAQIERAKVDIWFLITQLVVITIVAIWLLFARC